MNQLLLDLSALKAEVLLDWGQGSYCHCLVGKMAKVMGVQIIDEITLEQFAIDTRPRFEGIGVALNKTVEPNRIHGSWKWGHLIGWNDAPGRTQADVVRLIQDTFDRESRR